MKLNSILMTIVAVLTSTMVFAQPIEPVMWSSSVEKIAEDEYRITYKASIEQGWHIYDMGPYEGGPMATSFTFEPSSDYELVGGVEPKGDVKRHFDQNFGMEIGYYEDEVIFSQIVKSSVATIVATVDYMACNDSNCITGDYEFKTKVGESAAVAPAQEVVAPAQEAGKGGSIWGYIFSAVGWALIALLTPCVFPMIPMTV
ncbi:MAG: hypothetical protein J6V27_04665, partial [Alistipes sp.]|nr:hypothetical protein [Alistipes sp.]